MTVTIITDGKRTMLYIDEYRDLAYRRFCETNGIDPAEAETNGVRAIGPMTLTGGELSLEDLCVILGERDDSLEKVKAVVERWLDKQGHERCWYYPELFSELAALLGLGRGKVLDPGLPPREEFEAGCKRYQDEQYGAA